MTIYAVGISWASYFLVVVDYPTLSRDGGMTEDHGAQEAGKLPGSRPEVVERRRFVKESMAQRVCSWTVQNEMRCVLGRVSAGASGRIFDCADPREIRT